MIKVTIADTDRSKLVDPASLIVRDFLTQQVNTAEFVINKFGSRTFAPEVGQDVAISVDGTTIFGGRIVEINQNYDKLDFVGYQISCVDYTRDLDRKLVVETYEDQTINAIIADMQTQGYIPADFSLTNVNAPITIRYIAFNYEYVSQCLKQLAEAVNYDWYVSHDKSIYFFSKEANAAPFELSDTGGKYVYESLIIRRDISPIRNTIYVRGGEYQGEPFTVELVADGSQLTFPTSYKFSNLVVSSTGQVKNFGIDPIDDITNYDGLHNFQERFIRFRDDKKPTLGSIIKISGNPWLPVIVKVRDNNSIAAFSATEGNDGIYEFKIIDKSIKTKEGARQRARAELLAYAQTVSEGEFITSTARGVSYLKKDATDLLLQEDGESLFIVSNNLLRTGQRIRVQSTLRGLDEYFIINKVETKPFGNSGDIECRVNLMTTRTFDMIALLQKLLTDKDKEITIAEDEVLDEIETGDETLTIQESITFTTEVPAFKWGAGGNPQLVWNLGEWS